MRLEQWTIVAHHSGVWVAGGYIFDDKKGRFKDGTFIHTSAIKSIDYKKRTITTLNSIYELR